MKPGEFFARLDRVQRSRGFKIVATVVAAALAVTAFVSLWVAITSSPDPFAGIGGAATAARSTGLEAAEEAVATATGEAAERLNELRRRSGGGVEGWASLAVSLGAGVGVALAAALVVIWLGLTLTYLGLFALAALVAGPLLLFPSTEAYGRVVAGAAVLTATFTALLQGLRLAFAPSHPVLAIARNVLAEAVRLKISLVFIVLLIVGLAMLPGLLDAEQPLRYRVQTFLQFATTGTFVLLAILTLFFGCATVAFEQRDKVIWQTMTKPVSAWQYLLGKWLGVAALNAALLSVCAAGIFLFAEYLRSQPAKGEVAPYVAAGQEDLPPEYRTPTEDRLVLESQVLVARRSVEPEPPVARDDERFVQLVEARAAEEAQQSPDGRISASLRAKIEDDLFKSLTRDLRNIPPAPPPLGQREYVFRGLGEAAAKSLPITVRYKPDYGSNAPDVQFTLTFLFPNSAPYEQQHAPGVTQTLPLLPAAVDEQGTVRFMVMNGRFVQTPEGIAFLPNEKTVRFDEGAMEISYAVGSYRLNFLRVMGVLWLKLGFLAMVAIAASTFLSFPVAALVSLGFLFTAEMSGYLADAVTYVKTVDDDGNFMIFQGTATYVAEFISRLLLVYSDLRPAGRLVEGRLLPWGQLGLAVAVFGTAGCALYAAGALILRRRELAVYSGQ